MHVNDDARLEPGKHLEEQEARITAGLHDMRRIDEKHIVTFERLGKRRDPRLAPSIAGLQP